MPEAASRLARRLGYRDAVSLGLGSMLGVGLFAALAPAAAAAGSGLLVALGTAALVAAANATSTARLAAADPRAGGNYAYGRARLGPTAGFVAGWAFCVGKSASCAAAALAAARYALPDSGHAVRVLVALGGVVAVVVINYRGVTRTATATRWLLAVLLVLLAVVVAGALSGDWSGEPVRLGAGADGLVGLLRGAGLLFFAFAGYARVATLGEEVRDPARTIPRAVATSLSLAFVIYVVVAVAVLGSLGTGGLASSGAALADAAASGHSGGTAGALRTVARVGAVTAALGTVLALIAGIGRTAFAMSHDAELPRTLAVVHPRFQVPHRAEVAAGVVVGLVVLSGSLLTAIGLSSFCVLTYYAVGHLAALRLPGRFRWVAVPGLVGCLGVAALLPVRSVLIGAAVVGLGCVVRMAVQRSGKSAAA